MDTSFDDRLKYAIGAIFRNEDSRERDNCYEMYDGDQLVTAIVREAEENIQLQNAIMRQWSNVDRWIDHPWHKTAIKFAGILTPALASEAAKARMRGVSKYRTEMTNAGEQMVIPDCELDAPQTGTKQMELF